MRERVIPDRVALLIDTLRDARELVRLNADQEESCRGIFFAKHVENFRSPLRVWSIIKRDRDFIRAVTVTADSIRLGQSLEDFVGDQLAVGIDRQIARAMGRRTLDAQDFPLSLHVDVSARRYVAQFVRSAGVSLHIPNAP